MVPKKNRNYQESDSPFYRLRAKSDLASLLFIGRDKLKELSYGSDLYFEFKKPKNSGGFRDISAPRQDLKDVQSRIAKLLQRISPPDYLFAPVAGRSYVDNAAVHRGAMSIHLLDIEDFFPSCTENRVIWFFRNRMQCSPDVASILKCIVTRNGSLPQGSPCSPILAYLCYIDMWHEISRIVTAASCKLSVYADDLTISGRVVPQSAIWNIKMVLRRHGHRYNAAKERSRHRSPAEITGVILTLDGLRVPNRQHQKIHAVREALGASRSPATKAKLQIQLRGRQAQMAQITVQNERGGT